MIDKILASLILATCVVLAVRMLLSEPRRQRFDALMLHRAHQIKSAALRLYRWRASRRNAAREAQAAIQRARSQDKPDGQWQGNVYTPKSFDKKPRKPH